jgi:hypothetical protein
MNKQRLRLVEKDLSFRRIRQADVPRERKGKHHSIVALIVRDLARLNSGEALQIPRRALGEEKPQNIRAALNRAVKKAGFSVSTSMDANNFYVWIADNNT